MARIVDVVFEVNLSVIYRTVMMNLKVTNNSPNDYYISSLVVMQNLEYSCLPFAIVGPSKIYCNSDSSGYPEGRLLLLGNYESVSNDVPLSDICNFQLAKSGVYYVLFNTYFNLYKNANTKDNTNDFANMDANVSFIIEDVTKEVLVGESMSDNGL